MPTVIDLFAGAGGFGLGFRLVGYELCLALEIDHWACWTLRTNKADAMVVVEDDITRFQSSFDIAQICNVRPDVIIGGPPCQGFSIAGPAHKKDPKDPRNSLFRDFARWVEYLEPSVFVMENVKGILAQRNASHEKVIDIIRDTFISIGYTVEVWILNAVEYGVPQIRERVFIVGNRLGLEMGPPSPTHHLPGVRCNSHQRELVGLGDRRHSVKVWDAISDLPKLMAGEGDEEQRYTKDPRTEYQSWAREDQEILYNHAAMMHRQRTIDRFKLISWKGSVGDVPDEHRARKRNGNGEISDIVYDSNNRRLHPFSPSYTVPAYFYSSFIHPYQHRNITAREAARLQSFPDWYRFMGKRTVISRRLLERLERHDENYLSQYNQIGNAVPPLLAKAIASHILSVMG